jgi:multimeric flavodoxin WrbA
MGILTRFWMGRNRKRAAVVSARRAGTKATFDQLNRYFTISGMPVILSFYWNKGSRGPA